MCTGKCTTNHEDVHVDGPIETHGGDSEEQQNPGDNNVKSGYKECTEEERYSEHRSNGTYVGFCTRV